MFAKINHVAMLSTQFAMLGRFYQALFGMKTSADPVPQNAVSLSDGYVGLNINMRRPGRPSGLDHFGIEVTDIEEAFSRIAKHDSSIRWIGRPPDRPYAGTTTHDPDGNVFDLSQAALRNRADVYAQVGWTQDRYIDHFAMRTRDPRRCAEFYCEVFELEPVDSPAPDGRCCVTDGRVSLAILPWDIRDYEGSGISRAGPEHFGFRVESLQAVKQEIEKLSDHNFLFAPWSLSAGGDTKARRALLERCCPIGKQWIADIDGVVIHLNEGKAA
jgi:catechol 2,3-dioxygenase-like lactoylglutathione lyase family enzyme